VEGLAEFQELGGRQGGRGGGAVSMGTRTRKDEGRGLHYLRLRGRDANRKVVVSCMAVRARDLTTRRLGRKKIEEKTAEHRGGGGGILGAWVILKYRRELAGREVSAWQKRGLREEGGKG